MGVAGALGFALQGTSTVGRLELGWRVCRALEGAVSRARGRCVAPSRAVCRALEGAVSRRRGRCVARSRALCRALEGAVSRPRGRCVAPSRWVCRALEVGVSRARGRCVARSRALCRALEGAVSRGCDGRVALRRRVGVCVRGLGWLVYAWLGVEFALQGGCAGVAEAQWQGVDDLGWLAACETMDERRLLSFVRRVLG